MAKDTEMRINNSTTTDVGEFLSVADIAFSFLFFKYVYKGYFLKVDIIVN